MRSDALTSLRSGRKADVWVAGSCFMASIISVNKEPNRHYRSVFMLCSLFCNYVMFIVLFLCYVHCSVIMLCSFFCNNVMFIVL